ncbi:MAG: ACP S-malonyltransferase [Pyrinomonadaceae bacterium]|nr:ACP S-malonyltransferase [Pyrinomonadaceae bacterium]MBP6212519.1 ACP S-malonyltransferase [Pyrinomonadaceae bacterium]
MSKTAYIFPGQGSQSVGMGKDLFDNFAAAREVFEAADEALGFSLSEMCFSGDEADLQLTANTQPAILTASVAAFHAAMAEGMPEPDFVAGHSLGEYSALVAAGVLDFADAVRTVRKRGTYMQEAVPVGVGAMAAILGLGLEEVEAGCAEAAQGQVCTPANINSPSQIVIAGNAEAIDRACEILKGMGAKRAIKLNVSAPFHCALMMPAQERLASDLKALDYEDLAFPIVQNVDAEINRTSSSVCEKLTQQVSSPVRWLQSVQTMSAAGVSRYVEIGPGKVLTGLVRQIDREVSYANIEDSTSLSNTLETL